MKKFSFLLLAIFLFVSTAAAQSGIRMKMAYGSENVDLMSLLYFEDVGFGKMMFAGEDLKGKDYQISIREFVGGNPARSEVVFDSKEDEYFKVKDNNFVFHVLTKTTGETVKFQFQFNGFSKAKEYKIPAGEKDFVLKNFLGRATETEIPIGQSINILTYMMPYRRPDGSSTYCEVVQSGVRPEDLGKKYAIPTYFLIDIKFQ
jgi:hypothetical protein